MGAWKFFDIPPSSRAGYKKEITTTLYSDKETISDTSTFSIDVPEYNFAGSLYCYRLTSFPFALLRKNGVSPMYLMDIINFDVDSREITSAYTGLVNGISQDSVISGSVVLGRESPASNFHVASISPMWSDVVKWCDTLPGRHFRELDLCAANWEVVVKNIVVEGSPNKAEILEMPSPWKMVKGFDLHSAYLTSIKVMGPSGQSCVFNGLVAGKMEARVRAAMSFLNSIGPSISLG